MNFIWILYGFYMNYICIWILYMDFIYGFYVWILYEIYMDVI